MENKFKKNISWHDPLQFLYHKCFDGQINSWSLYWLIYTSMYFLMLLPSLIGVQEHLCPKMCICYLVEDLQPKAVWHSLSLITYFWIFLLTAASAAGNLPIWHIFPQQCSLSDETKGPSWLSIPYGVSPWWLTVVLIHCRPADISRVSASRRYEAVIRKWNYLGMLRGGGGC